MVNLFPTSYILCYNTHAHAGINELLKFVNVALHTVSCEGAIATDNLSRMTIVGSGYSPFIYDLHQNSDFDHFVHCCNKVWDALQRTPTLSDELVSFYMPANYIHRL